MVVEFDLRVGLIDLTLRIDFGFNLGHNMNVELEPGLVIFNVKLELDRGI